MPWKALIIALSICPLAAFARTPKLFGVPVQYTNDSGYVFGAAGTFQYDYNGFSDGGFDPMTGAPLFKSAYSWNRSELDPYFETPNGLKVQLGYDWNRSCGGSARAGATASSRTGSFSSRISPVAIWTESTTATPTPRATASSTSTKALSRVVASTTGPSA